MAVVLLALAAALAAQAAPTPLNARLIARPFTPGDVSRSGLPSSTEYSGGLNTVGIGTPVYLEADVNISVPVSAITNVSLCASRTSRLDRRRRLPPARCARIWGL